jgi:addiction module HigA family antidote
MEVLEMSERQTIGSIHPGEVIREDFLIPLGKSAYWLAKGLGITESAVGEILKGKRAITPATALRLERFLGCSAEFWLGLQSAYELDEERARLERDLQEIEPAALSELTQARQRAVEERCRPLVAALPEERQRLVDQ